MLEMWILDPMVLPDDVVLVPTQGDSSRFVVRRVGSSSPDLPLPSPWLALLDGFRAPRSIVDVVMEYSEEQDLDPDQTLEETFPLFEQLLRKGWLQRFVASHHSSTETVSGETVPGETVPSETVPSETGTASTSTWRRFVQLELQRLHDPENNETVFGTSRVPTCSLAFGAAGVAYGLFRLAVRDRGLLDLAQRWLNRALNRQFSPGAFHGSDLDLTTKTVGRITPYHTVSGVHVVRALVARARNDDTSWEAAVTDFIAATNHPCTSLDLTLGQAGTLLATCLLAAARGAQSPAGLQAAGQGKAELLASRLKNLPPVAEDQSIRYLGVAHGWGGLLYVMMTWCQVSSIHPDTGLETRLAELAELAEGQGRGLRWPSMLGSRVEPRFFPTWCNGSAGLVHLWILAYRIFGDERYLRLAERSCWNTWEEGLSVGNLCCGYSGRAYALLGFFKITGETTWLHRARQLATAAVNFQPLSKAAPDHSLLHGRLGTAILIRDLEEPESAAMPFFELEQPSFELSGLHSIE